MPYRQPLPRTTGAGAAASAAERLFARSPDLLCVAGLDGHLQHINPAFERTVGWTSEELLARPVIELVHPDDRAATQAAVRRLVADGTPMLAEHRFRCRDGSYRRLAWHVTPPDEHGRLDAVGRDVTERTEATQRALRESEARYEHIAAHLPGMVYQFVYRPDGSKGYTFVSEGAHALFGIAPEALLQDPAALLDRIHPEDRAHFRELALAAAAALGPFRWDGRVILPSGEERFIQVAARDYRRPDGTVVSDGLVMDATELHRATQRLEESEQRYRSLFEHNPDAVYSLDLDMRYTSVNPACEAVSGHPAADILAGTVTPLVIPEDREVASAGFRAALEGRATRFEVGIRHRSGSVVRLGVTNVPIVVGGRVVGVFGIAKDLTAQRELEEHLRQAQKLESLGRLAGGVAHEFNNLLMVITAYAAGVADELPADGQARADVDEIRRAAGRAAELTAQLLAFGRRQLLRPRLIDATGTVSNVAAMLRRVLGEDITVDTELATAVSLVHADPGQLEQVLLNLALNARDAMPGGGTLRLRTGAVPADSVAPAPGKVPPATGRYVALVVEDTGTGIAPTVLPRIFEPFFTTKEVGKGTGLGLATVYGIVDQSGGSVLVESTPGRGSRFTVLLPEAETPTAAGTPAPARSALPRGTETILLVEDEPTVRAAVRRMLERQGYRVHDAGGAAEALRALEDAGGDAVDLVLTDVVMPVLHGRELVERLAARWPELRVVYMSGYTDDEILRRGLMQPGATFLEKPFTPEQLARAVRRALDRPEPARTA